MKTFNLGTLFFCLLGLFLIPACGGDDDSSDPSGCGTNFNFQTELAAETTALSDATQVWVNDPTTENCNAYKAAATAYLDAAIGLEDCAILAGQATEFNQAVADAQASVDAIVC